jgi:hypothetical protein
MFPLSRELTARDLLQRRVTDTEGSTAWADSPLIRAAREGEWGGGVMMRILLMILIVMMMMMMMIMMMMMTMMTMMMMMIMMMHDDMTFV